MHALVVGGTSGLGLELAKLLQKTHEVVITGTEDRGVYGITFHKLDFGSGKGFPIFVDWIVRDYIFDTVIYNPGFHQEGRISDLSENQILDMSNVGFLGAAVLMQRIMKKQNQLSCFVAITSTSQWIPRELEPVYAGVKAGLGMLANSLALDSRIKKTLVVGPAGMKTKFWAGTDRDTSTMLDAPWVAQRILELLQGEFKYRHARILREPARVEMIEARM